MFRQRRSNLIVTFTLLSLLIVILSWRNRRNRLFSPIDCGKSVVEPSKNFYSNLIYLPDVNLLFCDVPKAASTNLRRLILHYLKSSNTSTNIDRKQIWIDEKHFFKRFSLTENSFSIVNQSNSNIFKFLLVRHPFRRIYSVYYDKFVNNQLDDTISGWKQLEEDILLQINQNETLISIRRNESRLDLRTFLLYIIDSIKYQREINSHWQCIVQRCAVCRLHYHWVGKIEQFPKDSNTLMDILHEHFHRNDIQFPSKDVDQKEKKSLELNDSELISLFRRTINNRNDFQVLIDYYLDDFRIFHYEIPSVDQ